MNGKGSRRRPTNEKSFGEFYEKIFSNRENIGGRYYICDKCYKCFKSNTEASICPNCKGDTDE